jgi:hypothetical protein
VRDPPARTTKASNVIGSGLPGRQDCLLGTSRDRESRANPSLTSMSRSGSVTGAPTYGHQIAPSRYDVIFRERET